MRGATRFRLRVSLPFRTFRIMLNDRIPPITSSSGGRNNPIFARSYTDTIFQRTEFHQFSLPIMLLHESLIPSKILYKRKILEFSNQEQFQAFPKKRTEDGIRCLGIFLTSGKIAIIFSNDNAKWLEEKERKKERRKRRSDLF